MANVTTVVSSSKWPPATEVKLFLPAANRHFEGKPSGTASAEATVAATGKVTFTNLPEGIYAGWASVAGTNANLQVCNVKYDDLSEVPLRTRIKTRREEEGIE